MKSSVRLTKITSFMFIKIPHYLASNESKEVDAVFVVNILTKELHQGLLLLLLILNDPVDDVEEDDGADDDLVVVPFPKNFMRPPSSISHSSRGK